MTTQMEEEPRLSAQVLDSGAVAAEVAAGGTLRFYLRTLKEDPRKILVGVLDSLQEVARFLTAPRFPMTLTLAQRLQLVRKWIVAEIKVPGGTTLLETIWLAYSASRATSLAKQWVEVGCFKGLSTVRLSLLCSTWDRHLNVFDTFAGLPGTDSVYDAVDSGVSYHFKAGSYEATEQEVRRNVAEYGDSARVKFVKGDVENTLRGNTLGPISFAFLDVDLVESYKACFSGLAGNIERGTVIVIHEACYAPIRDLIEDVSFWKANKLHAPRIEYIAERYRLPSCRNLAFLSW